MDSQDQNRLQNEVAQLIEQRLGQGVAIRADWFVHEVVLTHPDVHGADADWHTRNSYLAVREAVRKAVQRYRPKKGDAESQLVMPGCEYLQKGYLVDRGGEQCVVPTEQLTRDEIRAKMRELEGMAEGCLRHRDELAKFLEMREYAGAAE